ncbi:LytTR family DNA-binding domain-containing protein [uncultured Croceitalea sp.]|uniref:LytR/AlgR family response regulator transcription factor n=1 Tax=uncultured Croceitalea sp. TaxID=1798908 RepID=UPI003305F923
MEYNCLIIEDQLQAQRVLQKHIAHVPHLQLLGTFTNAIDAIEFLKSGNRIDILFLDINLPKLSGIELLKLSNLDAQVIITTAYSEYAVEGFELDVCDYLLKPISFERFFKAISKVVYANQTVSEKEDEKEFIFAKDGHDIIKIYLSDIRYVNSDSDFTSVKLVHKTYLLSYSLKFWQGVLPKGSFFRCHKSYIVNIEAIDKISGNLIYMGEDRIPVGRTSKELLLKKINLI